MLLQISDKWYPPPYIIYMIFSSIYLYIPLYIPIYPIYDMFLHKSSIENIYPVENVVCKPGKESCTSTDMEVATCHHHHHHHHVSPSRFTITINITINITISTFLRSRLSWSLMAAERPIPIVGCKSVKIQLLRHSIPPPSLSSVAKKPKLAQCQRQEARSQGGGFHLFIA